MEIIGHRGAADSAPENTLAAIRQGFHEGADAVEIDVHLTRDGRIVVIHDADTRRTTGHEGRIAEMTLAEIARLDAGRWKGRAWQGEKIPTLEAVLETVPAGKRLLIEVKCGPEVLDRLQKVVTGFGKRPEETAVISFSLPVVRQAKQRMPQYPVYWIQGTTPKRDAKSGVESGSVAELIETCREAGLEALDLAHNSRLEAEHVERLHALGKKLYVWTVNRADDVHRVARLGVDGITSDRPGWLRQELAQRRQS